MRKHFIIYSLLLFLLPLSAQQKVALSEEADISILICGPSHDASFTLYGHAAIRINDPINQIDAIFNYGLFDFSKSDFIYRFAKGETDYRLGATNFLDYIIEYQMRGSSVDELILNLTEAEKNRIWDALLINYLPENRVYRYNFFFDNCATRLVSIVEKQVDGQVRYDENQPRESFRELITQCTQGHNWLTFGCDLALGSPTDRTATPHERMFLPIHLMTLFKGATINQPDGHSRPLVKAAVSIAPFDPDINAYPAERITPMIVGLLLLFTTWCATYLGWRKNKHAGWADVALFSVAGLAGCLLFFISCLSLHPSVFPNWSLVWLHPLHIAGALAIAVKRWAKAAYYYHFINFVALTLLLAGWFAIPQQMNTAFIPLILILLTRSGYTVYRCKKQNG